jgi:hypothetical protein
MELLVTIDKSMHTALEALTSEEVFGNLTANEQFRPQATSFQEAWTPIVD